MSLVGIEINVSTIAITIVGLNLTEKGVNLTGGKCREFSQKGRESKHSLNSLFNLLVFPSVLNDWCTRAN